MTNYHDKREKRKFIFFLFFLIFSLIHLQSDLVHADSKLSMPFVSSREIMDEVVADALRALGDENIEIVAQGSWISGKEYKDPRLTNILNPSDHDMRMFFRRPPSEKEMLGTWKKFKDQLERELKKWKDLGFISADEMEKIRKTINIYPPEELMKGVNNAQEAAAKFRQWNIFPGLADTNVEGSFGNMLKFERQGYELGERGTSFYLDKGKVRRGSVDLVHWSEGYGKRTVQNLAAAARDKFESVIEDIAKGDYRSAQKHLKRGRQFYEEARKKARVPNEALEETLEKLEKRLEELVAEQRKVASGIDLGVAKIRGSDAELKAINEKLAKLSSEIKEVIDEIIAKNTILEAFEEAIKANKSREAYFFRKLAQGLEASFNKARNATVKALKTIGSEAANAVNRLGFMNIIGAYFILNDLPEYYAKGENDKMIAKLGMGIATLAIPGLGEGELIAILAHTIAESAVNYVSGYGYKAVTSTQYCDALVAGLYSVYGRQTAEVGALRQCPIIDSMRTLACSIPDKEGLTNYLAMYGKIDPKLIPPTLTELVRCHAENASYSGYERRSDKGVEQALFNRCSNALIQEWIEHREASIAHSVGLISQIGRLLLTVSYDPKEAVIKENSKAKIVFNSEIIGDLESIKKELDKEYACLGGKDAKFYFSKDYTWKVDGQILTRAGESSFMHEFEKEGTYSVCLELHIRYDFQGGELGRNRPSLLDGRMTKTACVDVTVKKEPETIKKVEIVDPSGNTPQKEFEEGKESFFKVKLIGGNPEDLVAVWALFPSKEKRESLWGGKGQSLSETHRLLPDSPGEFILRVELYDRMTYYTLKPETKLPVAQAEINILVKPSIDRLMEKVNIRVKSSGGKIHTPARGIRQDSDDRTLGVITLGESITLNAEIEAPESIRAYLKEPVWQEFYYLHDPDSEFEVQKRVVGQGNNFIFTPKKYGTFSFGVEVGVKGSKKIAKSEGFNIRVECKKEERGGTTIDVCKTEDADRVEPLEAWLDISNSKPKPGEEVLIKTRVKGGVIPYSFKYNLKDFDSSFTSDEIIIKADPKMPNIDVEVTDRKGNKAKARAVLNIGGLDVSIEGIPKQVYFGQSLFPKLRGVPNLEKTEILWVTSPTITVDNEKGILTFDRLGNVRIIADLRKTDTKETIGSSEEFIVTVIPPKARLTFEPPVQKLGGLVTAKLSLDPNPEIDTVQIRWLSPGTKDRDEISHDTIRFKAKEKPEKVEVLVLGKRGGDTLVQLSGNYDPTGKATNIETIEKTAIDDQKKKEYQKTIDEAKNALKEGRFKDALAALDRADKILPGQKETKELRDTTNAEQKALDNAINQSEELTKRAEFEKARSILKEFKNKYPKLSVIDEALNKILQAEKAKLTADVQAAYRRAEEFRKRAQPKEALGELNQALKLDPDYTPAKELKAKIERDLKEMQERVTEAKKFMAQNRYKDAFSHLRIAEGICRNCPEVVELMKKYQDDSSKYEGELKNLLYNMNSEIERRNFAKALQLAKEFRAKYSVNPEGEGRIKSLEEKAMQMEAEKDKRRHMLKNAEAKFRNYDYAGAVKDFDEAFRDANIIWSTEDSEISHYQKLKEEAMQKNKRINELSSNIKNALNSPDSYYSQVHVLESLLKQSEELIVLQPNNEEWKKLKDVVSQRLEKVKAERERIAKGQNYLNEAVKWRNNYLSQESYLKSNPRSWNEQIELSMQNYLTKAIENYKESLKYMPDRAVEKTISELETILEGRKKFLENYGLSLKLRAEADKAAQEARDEIQFEVSQQKYKEAIDKYQKSIQLYHPPDEETIAKIIHNLDIERKTKAFKKYWADGTSLEKANKFIEALAALEKAAGYRTYAISDGEWLKFGEQLQNLKNRIELAKWHRSQGETNERAGNLKEAINHYQLSLKNIYDAELESRLRNLEQKIKDNEKKAIADRLWNECIALAKANRLNEAVTKCEESLKYYSREDRLKALTDLRAAAMKAQQEAQNKQTADKLWSECIELAKAKRLNEAISKCEQSLNYWRSEERQKALNQLKNTAQKVNEESKNKQIADKLWNECIELARQKNYEQAWRKCDESLKYWHNDQRIEATAKLKEEARKTNTSSIPSTDSTIGNAIKPPAISSSSDISGKWSTNWGEMNLTVSGDKVSGSYATNNGRIYGDLYNNVLEGYWTQSSSARRCSTLKYDSYYWGKIRFNFEGNKFKGNWSYCNEGIPSNANHWTGERISTGSSLSQPPLNTVKAQDIFNNGNIAGVYNNPTRPTVFIINQPHVITLIQNYHWNNGRGSTPGTIALRDQSGRAYGPWQAKGSPGQGGVPNAYWTVYPNITLSAGTYTVIDSEPSTWAQNSGSNGAGHTRIEGYPVSETGNQQIESTVQQGRTINVELTNNSRENVHIFVEGQDTFGPHNRVIPNERKTVSIKAPNQAGFINFVAGRNGQVLAKCRWEYVPDYQNRVPVIRFSDPNILSCSTGMR